MGKHAVVGGGASATPSLDRLADMSDSSGDGQVGSRQKDKEGSYPSTLVRGNFIRDLLHAWRHLFDRRKTYYLATAGCGGRGYSTLARGRVIYRVGENNGDFRKKGP